MLAEIPFHLRALKRVAPSQDELLSEQKLRSLLRRNSSGGKEHVQDKRAGALLTAAHPGQLKEGLERFRSTLSLQAPLTPDDQFRLAQLSEMAGEQAKADALLEELLVTHRYNGQYLAGQVRSLAARGQFSLAKNWLRRLQDIEPDSGRVRSLRALLD
jgi:Flp pilus assembly protein TadD